MTLCYHHVFRPTVLSPFPPPSRKTPTQHNVNAPSGLSELPALKSLESASLRHCSGLGGEATLCLSNSPALETLSLAHCPLLDDAAVGNLVGLSRLRFLELEGCEVRVCGGGGGGVGGGAGGDNDGICETGPALYFLSVLLTCARGVQSFRSSTRNFFFLFFMSHGGSASENSRSVLWTVFSRV